PTLSATPLDRQAVLAGDTGKRDEAFDERPAVLVDIDVRQGVRFASRPDELGAPIAIRRTRRQLAKGGMDLIELALEACSVLLLPIGQERLEKDGKAACEPALLLKGQMNGIAKQHEVVLGFRLHRSKLARLVLNVQSDAHGILPPSLVRLFPAS